MKTKFNFSKKLFSNCYKIFEGNKEIGFIKKDYFSQKTTAEINGKKFIYLEKSPFERNSKILDSEEKTIGIINYNTWESKASLQIGEEKLSWQYKNIWNTNWKIESSNGKIIEFNMDGNINIDRIDNNEIEILSGLYLYKYYKRVVMLFLVFLFIPIFLNSFLKLMN